MDTVDYAVEQIEKLEQEIEDLREEIADGNAAYQEVLREACEGGVTYGTDDRLHCTCVPHLREGVKTLTARLAAAEEQLGKAGEMYKLCCAERAAARRDG